MRGPVSTGFLYPLDVLSARCGVAAPAGRGIAAGRIPAAMGAVRLGLEALDPRPRALYGRQTRLMSDEERIGDIVEILAGV